MECKAEAVGPNPLISPVRNGRLGRGWENVYNFTITSENQCESELSACGRPPGPTNAFRRQKRNQKESKQGKMCLQRGKNNYSGNPLETTLSFSLKHFLKSLAVPHRMLWLPLSGTLDNRIFWWFWLKQFRHHHTLTKHFPSSYCILGTGL